MAYLLDGFVSAAAMSATTSAKYAELLAIAKDLQDAATSTGA